MRLRLQQKPCAGFRTASPANELKLRSFHRRHQRFGTLHLVQYCSTTDQSHGGNIGSSRDSSNAGLKRLSLQHTLPPLSRGISKQPLQQRPSIQQHTPTAPPFACRVHIPIFFHGRWAPEHIFPTTLSASQHDHKVRASANSMDRRANGSFQQDTIAWTRGASTRDR